MSIGDVVSFVTGGGGGVRVPVVDGGGDAPTYAVEVGDPMTSSSSSSSSVIISESVSW